MTNKIFKINLAHKPIFNLENYLISENGDVWSEITNKYLSPAADAKGYLRFGLMNNGKLTTYKAHRLVAQAFLRLVEGCDSVNHIDSNKKNNNYKNLEWCTNKQNTKHAIDNNNFYYSAGHNRKTLPQNIIDLLGKMPDYKLAELANCSKTVIRRLRKKYNIKSYAENTGINGKFK